jgi:MFS family permease
MAVSAPVFVAFVLYERVKARKDGSPLVELSLFRQRSFSVGMGIAFAFFMGIASFGLVLTLFLQVGMSFTPLHAGLTFLPFSAGVLISSGAAARLAPRFGRGVTMAGALIIAAGMGSLIVLVHHYGAAVSTWDLVPGLVAAGLGLGAFIAPLADIVLDGVPGQHAGSASGVFNTGLQLGNSVGIALIGVIFFGLLGTQSASAAHAVTPQLRAGLTAVHVPAQYAGRIERQFADCLHARLVASDPTVTPAACRLSSSGAGHAGSAGPSALPAGATRVLATVGATAVRRDFAAALERTLWFQVAVFMASFMLMLALPRGVGRRRPAGAGSNDGARASASESVVIG